MHKQGCLLLVSKDDRIDIDLTTFRDGSLRPTTKSKKSFMGTGSLPPQHYRRKTMQKPNFDSHCPTLCEDTQTQTNLPIGGIRHVKLEYYISYTRSFMISELRSPYNQNLRHSMHLKIRS